MRGQDGTEQDIADCGFISIHLPTDILCIWAEILICLQPEIRKINCKYICIVCASLPLCACVCRWLSQMISIWLSKSPAQMSLKFTAAAANYQRHFIILQSVNKCTHPLTHTHTHNLFRSLSLKHIHLHSPTLKRQCIDSRISKSSAFCHFLYDHPFNPFFIMRPHLYLTLVLRATPNLSCNMHELFALHSKFDFKSCTILLADKYDFSSVVCL